MRATDRRPGTCRRHQDPAGELPNFKRGGADEVSGWTVGPSVAEFAELLRLGDAHDVAEQQVADAGDLAGLARCAGS
jgi:hypothetical protein